MAFKVGIRFGTSKFGQRFHVGIEFRLGLVLGSWVWNDRNLGKLQEVGIRAMALGWYELGLDGTREGAWKWLRNWAWDFEKNLILTLESRFKRHFNTNLEISEPKLELYSLSHPIFSLLF